MRKFKKVRLLERVGEGEQTCAQCCGLTFVQTQNMLGLKAYVQKYGQMSEDVALEEDHVEFEDWHLVIPFDRGNVNNLCCPEDVHCSGESRHSRFTCCPFCVAPVCIECQTHICKRTPELPPAALTNDMMIYYTPTEIYELNATVMELICASVCITSMFCVFIFRKDKQKQPCF